MWYTFQGMFGNVLWTIVAGEIIGRTNLKIKIIIIIETIIIK